LKSLVAFWVGTLILFGMFSQYLSSASQVLFAEPTMQLTPAATMDAPPTDCGPLPGAVRVSNAYAPVLGAWPVWGTLGSDGILVMPEEPTTDASLPGWWGRKVLWLVKTSYEGEVTLRGYHTADNSPMLFSFDNNPPTASPVLNPDNPTAFAQDSQNFANFPSGVFVSRAGCYVLEATWNGGLWRQTIAVGYVPGG
jgi:hypothetical protein